MTIGPEPITRIRWRSLRLGIDGPTSRSGICEEGNDFQDLLASFGNNGTLALIRLRGPIAKTGKGILKSVPLLADSTAAHDIKKGARDELLFSVVRPRQFMRRKHHEGHAEYFRRASSECRP